MDKLTRPDQDWQEPARENRGRMMRLKKGEEKPANARIMTENEVLNMQQKIIMEWKPRSEMWPFSWGLGILGGTSALSGMFINNFCRRQVGLMSLGRVGTFIPTVGLPVIISTIFHSFLVTNKILVGNFPCTVCAATRSGSIQAASGAMYAMVLGPLLCVANARKYHTYYVPGIRETAELLPFLRRVMPGPGALLGLVLLNFGIGMAISERETYLFAKYLNPTSSSLEKEDRDEPFL